MSARSTACSGLSASGSRSGTDVSLTTSYRCQFCTRFRTSTSWRYEQTCRRSTFLTVRRGAKGDRRGKDRARLGHDRPRVRCGAPQRFELMGDQMSIPLDVRGVKFVMLRQQHYE